LRNEYTTLAAALARAAELIAHGSWGQDITQVRVLDESGEPVGLDNDGFAALLKTAENVVRREHTGDL
jgi:protein-disulfide isomerase-like protein with CxxC motif